MQMLGESVVGSFVGAIASFPKIKMPLKNLAEIFEGSPILLWMIAYPVP